MAGTGGAGGTGGASENDCYDPADPTTQLPPKDSPSLRGFTCVAFRGERRCLNRCTTDQDCRSGRVCLPFCTPAIGNTPADLSRCPSGAAACSADGLCLTAQDACHPSKSCQPGETCVSGKCALPVESHFCGDGPLLTQNGCFPQLTSYAVNVNAGFLVTGSQAGSFSAGTTNVAAGTWDMTMPMSMPKPEDYLCRQFTATERDPRLVSRIPLRPYPGQPGGDDAIKCESPPLHPMPVFPNPKDPEKSILQTTTPFDMAGAPPAGQRPDRSGDGYYFDRFAPALEPTLDPNSPGKLADVSGSSMGTAGHARPEAPQLVEWMATWTSNKNSINACLYKGGPISSDVQPILSDPTTRPDRPQHLRARYRNTQVAFVLADVERAPAAGTNIHFDVHGGFRQQSVVMLSTVEVSAPARIVLGPFDSNRVDGFPTKAAPFFFVVDQRRLGRGTGGGPTRGQIVRVNPYGLSTSNGFLPVYEDFHGSNGLFPIQ